ncbi:MAG: hypothetical protein JW776_07730 [Candidatus Lokiarchaeota archaeon]|nr:hypothetical protein [Candidatus Lokiarchaeota archaeon]
MVFNPLFWRIILVIILSVTSIALYIISYRGFKKKNLYGGFSTLSCALFLSFFGLYGIFLPLFPWPYGPFFVIVIFIILIVNFIIWIIRKILNKTEEKTEQQYKKDLTLKGEYLRKISHLVGILVPIGYYWVYPFLNNWIYSFISGIGKEFYEVLWGDISLYPYSSFDPNAPGELILFTLWISLMFFLVPEFIRLLVRPEYSIFHGILKSVLRAKEYVSIGPQVLLILGAVFGFFLSSLGLYSYEIAVSATFTACLADGLVAVIGRRFGNHAVKLINGDKKSLEGFIAGFLSAYVFSMIILGPIYAVFAAIIFLILDIFPIPIGDNLLNPILLSIGVWGMQILIQLPIGWSF